MKCLKGGKRGNTNTSKKVFLLLPDRVTMTASTKALPVVDPYPESLIVKVKLKNGIPIAKQQRMGVHKNDFI